MCGFSGFLSTSLTPHAPQVLQRMTDAIRKRGPDDEGQWIDETAGIALGHRRLSIVDLSSAGHQPMVSESERFVIVFNGEIYNHQLLRAEIEDNMPGHRWRGHSDTETLLTGIECWGLVETLRRATGMFALALWDRQRRQLHIARDRIGEKPVYYGWQGQDKERVFLFGSDLRALWQHPSFRFEINRQGLSSLLQFGNVCAPLSIFEGINKLEPGIIATISLEQSVPVYSPYWSFQELLEQSIADPFTGTFEEGVVELERLLKHSISMQMEADVPVGAFLSGGVDSSLVVALMQQIARERGLQRVRTFTIGFSEERFNEAHFAMEVAKYLNTEHTEKYVTHADVLDVIPQLPMIYSEPFADSSQIPTFLVSKLARKFVTVSLSGDAGDELFCGYTRYLAGQKLYSSINNYPKWIRDLTLEILRFSGPKKLAGIYNLVMPLLPRLLHMSNLEDKFHKLEKLLSSESCSQNEIYRSLISFWINPGEVVIGAHDGHGGLVIPPKFQISGGFIDQMMMSDMRSYLPNDILTKVDRAAMAVSLETRIPMLDHSIVKHALRTPTAHKLDKGQGKWPLRQILYKHVPRELFERPKKGFSVPINDWIKGPLHDWTENLLDEKRLREEGYFHVAPIRRSLNLHMSGERDESSHLWPLLMFQAWQDGYKDEWSQLKSQ